MNYTPYSSKKKGNYVFYITIIIILLVIAIVAFVGLSNTDNVSEKPQNSSSNNKNNSQEYTSDNSSYNDIISDTPSEIISDIIPSMPTDDKTESEPYKQKSYTMPVNGEILKDFSADTLQYSATYGDMRLHAAVDIACKEGTFISALTDGNVLSIEESSTLGNVVTVDHGDGLIVKYASVKDSKVKAGDKINSGDIIGIVSTVPIECNDQDHLHIEATKDSKPISFLDFFK